MNKKTSLLLIFIIILLSVLYYFMQLDVIGPGEPELAFKKVTVAGDISLPPYEFVDQDGEYSGFNVDVMRAIALELGFEVTIVPMNWEDAQVALQNGEVDAIQGMRRLEVREWLYDFTEPYFENNYAIFSQNGSGINSTNDLHGKTITSIQGDASNQILVNLKGITVKNVSDVKSAIELVVNGEADAAIGNPIVGIYYINRLGINDQIDISSTDLSSAAYGMAVNKGNIALQRQLDLGLDRIKKNGAFDKIYEKWFGRPLNYQQEALINTLRFLWVGLIGIVAFSLALFIWNNALKKQVYKRTQELYGESQFNHALLQSMSNGILYLKGDTASRYLNAEGERLYQIMSTYGISTDELETLILSSDEDVFHDKEFKGPMGILNLEWRHKSVQLPDQKEFGHIIAFSDKTEKRYFEDAFLSQDRLRNIGLLMAEIAHEIRNPLTTIKNYAQLIPEKANNPKFLEAFSDDVPMEIDRLNDIISDVLDYTKPGVTFTDCADVEAVIRETLKMMQMRFDKRSIEATLEIKSLETLMNEKIIVNDETSMNEDHFDEYGEGAIKARVSNKHLKQVLLNIYLNAMEAIESAEAQSGAIHTKVELMPDQGVKIHISDTGKGMDQEEVQRLFEPFYSRKRDGTGLGIFICDRLLKLYGGSIYFESTPGKGTVCAIRLQGGGLV